VDQSGRAGQSVGQSASRTRHQRGSAPRRPDRESAAFPPAPPDAGLIRAAQKAARKVARLSLRQAVQRLYTLQEAAGYLATSYWTVRSYVESGTLRAVRLPGQGKLLRLDKADLDALIEAHKDQDGSV
jgi:excisionase family DNA binding protein